MEGSVCRPLFTQFCGNDADTVVAAARHVEAHTDYVDINFGCPQRIARRGHYGAFLMDDLDAVERLVSYVSIPNLQTFDVLPHDTQDTRHTPRCWSCKFT